MIAKRLTVVGLLLWSRPYGIAVGQEQAIQDNEWRVREHWRGSRSVIHSKEKFSSFASVGLQVVVDPNGTVESARAVDGPEQFYQQAERIESHRKFVPFEKNGIAVRATFQDFVSIVPPEKWGTRVPFPDVQDWTSLKMTLKRTECYGDCPAYSVEVSGAGEVTYTGSSSVVITGTHRSQISKESVQNLLAAFRRADYFSLQDEYRAGITDNPAYTTRLSFDGRTKKVVDYVGLEVGMPEAVGDLERQLDDLAGTSKWVKGNGQTGTALAEEGWNFRADTVENRVLFGSVVARGTPDLVQFFLQKGAPAYGGHERDNSAFVNAAAKGNLALVKQIVEAQSPVPHDDLACALGAAAQADSVPVIRALMEMGADASGRCSAAYAEPVVVLAARSGKVDALAEVLKGNPNVNEPGYAGRTALTEFLESSQASQAAEGIAMLVKAGADVNAQDEMRRTPIFSACHAGPEAVKALVAAGADVNVKSSGDYSPLVACSEMASVRVLLEAGADPSVVNRFGQTAAQEARASGNNAKADMLEGFVQPKANH